MYNYLHRSLASFHHRTIVIVGASHALVGDQGLSARLACFGGHPNRLVRLSQLGMSGYESTQLTGG